MQIARLVQLQVEIAGLNRAESQEVGDQPVQPLAAGIHVIEAARLAIGQRAKLAAHEQFNVSGNYRQRRAQIMRRGGQGLRASPVVNLQLLVRALQVAAHGANFGLTIVIAGKVRLSPSCGRGGWVVGAFSHDTREPAVFRGRKDDAGSVFHR